MTFDPHQPWYHGSPSDLTILRAGSTITQKRHLARIFSHKPDLVSFADDGRIKHNGSKPGYLYRIADEIGPDDVIPHPRTTMAPGDEWLTQRDLRLQLLSATAPRAEEQLTKAELADLRSRLREQREQKD